jgi:radical SAM-linked protein
VPRVSETTPASAAPITPEPPGGDESAGRPEQQRPADKVRIRFRKSGTLRLLSHHDLMRTFERLLRRSELPFHRSQGFHPKPRLIFALSLPLGVVGCEEVVELELGQILPPDEIHARLARQASPGLDIVSVRRIPLKTNAQVRRLSYALRVPAERLPDLTRRITEVLAASECWVDRHRPHSGQPGRRLDVRPFLVDLQIHRDCGLLPIADCGLRIADFLQSAIRNPQSAILEMVLHLTPAGTARPEEVLGLLGLEDLLDAGAVLERTRLELSDELPPSPLTLPSPPAGEEGRVRGDGGTELEKGSHEKRDAD